MQLRWRSGGPPDHSSGMFLRLIVITVVTVATALAAMPEVDSSQLPRVPPTPPELALGTFKIKPGFRLELVAAEPQVIDPIAMSFDEDGRLFVVEMRDYSERRPERLGRIRLLEDTNGDGRFDKSTVFAQDLPWPTAVTCWAGGIFVGCTPDIIWMKDTDADGLADVREVIFTGFGADYAPFATNKLNVQALMNSFQWTLDNRIHGATSFSGGKVSLVDSPFIQQWLRKSPSSVKPAGPALNLRGRDFSFDPRTLEMRAESGGGQHGMSFDDRGRKFVCANASHLQMVTYEDRYAARNPYFSLPKPTVDIAVDGGAAPVFRISPDEPWRVIRTQWRVAGLAPGPIEGGGRASGYFTGATGVTIYRGDAYGPDFVGDAFIGDAGGNLVHRKKLRLDGIGLRAERPADEQQVEFLASTDNWFRPVQFANAPDGCLYIADMYREVIEHPWSLPDSIKKHLDLNSGNDRGRIYRIVPERFRQPARQRLSRLSTKSLVPLLAHRNGWTRDTAARLLYERQDSSVVPAILASMHGRTEPVAGPREQAFAALHGMHVLAGMRALSEEELVGWLSRDASLAGDRLRFPETEDGLIISALKLSEPYLHEPSPALLAQFRALASRERKRPLAAAVEFQFLLSLTGTKGKQKSMLLREFIGAKYGDGGDVEYRMRNHEWIIPALLIACDEDPLLLTELLVTRPSSPTNSPPIAPLVMRETRDAILSAIARVVGTRDKSNEVFRVIECATLLGFKSCGTILAELQAGLQQHGANLVNHPALAGFASYFASALPSARPGATEHQLDFRLDSIRLIGFSPDPAARSNLLQIVVGSGEWKDYRRAALDALANSDPGRFGGAIVPVWSKLTPALRTQAVASMLRRREDILLLLQAIEAGSVQVDELSFTQRAQLRTHGQAEIRQRSEKLFGGVVSAARQSVVESFQSSLALRGDAANGRKIFQARCAACHKQGGEGHVLGPDLSTMKSGGKEKLLIAILDPNREVAPNFASYSVETKDGDSHVGIIATENPAGVTLRMAGGIEQVIARGNIATMQSQGRSLMSEGLEEGLSQQDMADLLEFVLAP
jgi:putative membrane-bound dehydrogenase-like protein